MFHRKKDEDIEEPQLQSRPRGAAGSTPNLRTSLYDSTTTGGNPQTGNYPIKGNDNSVVLQTGRKSSVRSLRSRRSSSRSSQYNAPYREPNPNKYDGGRAATRVPPPLQSDFTGSEPYDPYQDAQYSLDGQDNAQKGWSRTPLPQEFANLNLNDGQCQLCTYYILVLILIRSSSDDSDTDCNHHPYSTPRVLCQPKSPPDTSYA